jgi:hypothetical protein
MRNLVIRCSLTVAVVTLIVPIALAGTGIFGSYIGIDTGSGNTWYGAHQPGPLLQTAFDGDDLGDFTEGESMLISGGELLTWKSGSGDVTGANIYYAVHVAGTLATTFGGATINHTSDAPFNDAAGNHFATFGDQKWANIQDTPDVLSGVGAGDYDLSVYFTATTNEGTRYDNNNGNNYVANFSVTGVPEPAAILLALFGLALLPRSRRR